MVLVTSQPVRPVRALVLELVKPVSLVVVAGFAAAGAVRVSVVTTVLPSRWRLAWRRSCGRRGRWRGRA